MDIIKHLDELRAKATQGPWKTDDYFYIWGANMEMIADNDDEEAYLLRMRGFGANLPQQENRDYIVALENSYDTLRQAVLDGARYKAAGEALANNVKEIRIPNNPPVGNPTTYEKQAYISANLAWTEKRDAALTAYRAAIGDSSK